MLPFIVSWILSATALFVSGKIFDRVTLKGDFSDALWVACIYAALSLLFSWFLFGLLGVMTLGLGFVFSFVTRLIVAALVLKLTSALSSRFTITGFAPALATAMLLALASEASSRLSAMW